MISQRSIIIGLKITIQRVITNQLHSVVTDSFLLPVRYINSTYKLIALEYFHWKP